MRKMHYFIMSLLVISSYSYGQSKQWEKVDSAKPSGSQTESQFQQLLKDKSYSLGSAQQPSPRFGAASWQTGEGELIVFSGLGYDTDGHWGLLNDMWRYNTSSNKWELLSGDMKVDAQKWSEQTKLPIPRRNAVSWTDNQGNLFLMGGSQLNDTEYFYDLWKYTVKIGSWQRVSSKTISNTSAVWGQQKGSNDAVNPGSRSGATSWTDKNGNLWLFGGTNMDNSKGQQDLYNDLWMFSTKKSTWTWISGSDKANEKGSFGKKGIKLSDLAPSARADAASWYDEKTDKLWLYGGKGIDSTGLDSGGLSDLWCFDINRGTWQWVNGSAKLFSQGQAGLTYPGYRWAAASWKDKEGNFFLYGGQSKISSTEIDVNPVLWKFNLMVEKWSPVLANGAPGIMSGAKAFTDAQGNLLLFSGRKLNSQTMKAYPTNEIWKIKVN